MLASRTKHEEENLCKSPRLNSQMNMIWRGKPGLMISRCQRTRTVVMLQRMRGLQQLQTAYSVSNAAEKQEAATK